MGAAEGETKRNNNSQLKLKVLPLIYRAFATGNVH